MGMIFHIIGKSSSGKDTIYKKLLEDTSLGLKPIILYTTRPIRDGEVDGVNYHFTDDESFFELKEQGKIVEDRLYHTVHGDWRYFTVADENIDLSKNSYLVIGVLDSYVAFKNYYGSSKVVPLYIEVDDEVRLSRAFEREKRPENRKFKEMCRRFLADSEDFSEEKIEAAGITSADRIENDDLEKCLREIADIIGKADN